MVDETEDMVSVSANISVRNLCLEISTKQLNLYLLKSVFTGHRRNPWLVLTELAGAAEPWLKTNAPL